MIYNNQVNIKPLNQNKMSKEEKIKELDEDINIIKESLRGDGTDEAREWCEKYLLKLLKKRDKLSKSE